MTASPQRTRATRSLRAGLALLLPLALGLTGAAVPAQAAETAPTAQQTAARAPSAVPGITTSVEGRTLTVGWGAAQANGTPVTGYVVAVRPGTRTKRLGPDARRTTFTDLTPGTRYTVHVVATSAVNDGSEAIPAETPEPAPAAPAPAPPGAPSSLTVERDGSVVTLSWGPFSEEGSPVTGYRLTGAAGGTRTYAPTSRVATIEDLAYGKTYVFGLVATSAAGDSPEQVIRVTLDIASPTPVTRVRTVTDGDTATVTWDPALSDGEPVTGYVVALRPGNRTVTVGPDARSATFTGLTPGVRYTTYVAATTASDDGLGSIPPAVGEAAQKRRPSAVPDLRVVRRPRAVVARWWAPRNDGGTPVTSYRVRVGKRVLTVPAGRTRVRVPSRTRRAIVVAVRAKNAVGVGPANSVRFPRR